MFLMLNTDMYNFLSPVYLTSITLARFYKKTLKTWKENLNCTQKGPGPPQLGSEPRTMLLRGNSAIQETAQVSM